jgi:hypothetical protein
MKRSMSIVALALVLAACSNGQQVLSDGAVELSRMGGHTFVAHANGAQEVPANDSRAQGQVILHLSADGTALSYKLVVANIHDVTMAHIHLAPPGANGPVAAWLYPSGPPPQPLPGRSQGVLAEGVITAANLVGPLAGATLADLVEKLEAGEAYVNIHTTQFPPGEVRGNFHH